MRFRALGSVLLALLCAVALWVTSMLASAFVFGVERFVATIALLADESVGFVMGGTGDPEPDPGYVEQVKDLYLQPSSPLFDGQQTFDGYDFKGLFTPEQFFPVTPQLGDLTFGESVSQGVADLDDAVVPALNDGKDVAVFGYSQSGTVATEELNDLTANPPDEANLDNLHTVLIGDPNTAIGGILDRFQFPDGIKDFSLSPEPQHLPFLNVPLSIDPTPTDTATDIYTGEYDAYADFPQDPTNILADINALLGIVTVHPYYPDYTPGQLADTIDVGESGDTHFYDIPENLPLLQFLYNAGTPGQVFGDALSPFMRLVIDWGYGNAGDPGDALHAGDAAGGSHVDGLYAIPSAEGTNGANISGSPYEEAFGVAGGPWAATPSGELYDGTASTSVADSGIAGLFEKMDPLQMLAGADNALIQSVIGPFADVAAGGGALSTDQIDTIDGITETLRTITGYDLINTLDQGLLNGWESLDLQGALSPEALFDGPLIPGQPIIGLVGGLFDVFNFFGA
jgi:hypothetical protein